MVNANCFNSGSYLLAALAHVSAGILVCACVLCDMSADYIFSHMPIGSADGRSYTCGA